MVYKHPLCCLIVLILLAFCIYFVASDSTLDNNSKKLPDSSPEKHNEEAYERIKDQEKHNDPATHNFDYDDDYEKFMEETPQSSCFSEVGYDDESCILYARFRDSGSLYSYHDFEPEVFYEFINDESLGRYFNYYIKGYYYCERLE